MINNFGTTTNTTNYKQPKRSTQVKQKQTSKQQIINQLRDNKEIKHIMQNNANLYNKISIMFKNDDCVKLNLGELHVYLCFQKNNRQNNKDFNEIYNLFNLIQSSVDRKSINIYNLLELYKFMNAIRMKILTVEQYINRNNTIGKNQLESYYNVCKAILRIASQHENYTIDSKYPNILGEIEIFKLYNFVQNEKYPKHNQDKDISEIYRYVKNSFCDNRRPILMDKNITINEFVAPAKQTGKLTKQELQQLQEYQGEWRKKTPEEIELYKKQYVQQQSQRYTQVLNTLSNSNIVSKIGGQLENVGQPKEVTVSRNTGHYSLLLE